MSAIRVFLRSENPGTHRPQHSASKSLAQLIISAQVAQWVSSGISINGCELPPSAIQLLTDETWTQVKRRIRPSQDSISYHLKPPAKRNNFEFYYPKYDPAYPRRAECSA